MHAAAFRAALVCGALALPFAASADELVAIPLLGKGLDAEDLANVNSLVRAELEFLPGVSSVQVLDSRPSALTASCLSSTSCLRSIAANYDGTHLVAGLAAKTSDGLALTLTYYDKAAGKIVGSDTYPVPADPVALIDAIPSTLRTLVDAGSRAPTPSEEEDAYADVSFGGDDDELDFGDDSATSSWSAPPRQPEPAYTPAPAPAYEPPARSDDGIAQAPADEPSDTLDISFGGDASDITFDDSPSTPSYGSRTATTRVVEPEPAASPSPYLFDEEPAPVRDLDPLRERPTRSRAPSRTLSGSTLEREPEQDFSSFPRVQLNVKGGLTHYKPFNFGTVGAETMLHVTDGLHAVVGLNLYVVNRELPPDRQDETGRNVETNFIVPWNAGVVYKFLNERLRPYLGVDVIVSQYFRDEETNRNQFAFGARGRFGADYMITSSFGLHADAAFGFWMGNDWPRVDPRSPSTGFLPHFSAGFTFAF